MKCNKCGYDLKEENEYCPNCGTKVEIQQGKECCHCHYVMNEECNFCPQCGHEVIKESNGCKYCGYTLGGEESFCPNCGKETGNKKVDSPIQEVLEEPVVSSETNEVEKSIDTTVEEISQPISKETGGYTPISKRTTEYVKDPETQYTPIKKPDVVEKPIPEKKIVTKDDNSFWRNPILWIVSISLLVICVLLSMYMNDNPSTNKKEVKSEQKATEELDDIQITEDTTALMMQVNINHGGATYQFDDQLYLGINGCIYEMELDFSDAKKVVDESGEYIYVDDKYIYYCDEDYSYQRVDRETNKKETLLENVYYPRIIDGMLYYQADNDGETIHVYNLETKEDRKINNEKSYAMMVDVGSKVIYYTNAENALCKINIDGTASEVLVEKDVIKFIYDNGTIYYIQDFGIHKMDMSTKEDTILLEDKEINSIGLLDDKIVYQEYDGGISVVNKDGTKDKVITTNETSGFEIQGDIIIYKDNTKQGIYGATIDAKRALVYKLENNIDDEKESQYIDGMQEF